MTKLIAVATKAQFDAIQGSAHPFSSTSLVFILDTLLYWTHGIFINGVTATTGVSGDTTLRIAGTDYTIALLDQVHLKREDVDLGVHLENVGVVPYDKSYVLKATDSHKLLEYKHRTGSSDPGTVYLSSQDDNLVILAKNSIVRSYYLGIVTYNATLLDTINTTFEMSNNTLSYNFGSVISGDLYLPVCDTSSVNPLSNSTRKYTRIGSNNTESWLVINNLYDGTGGSFYQFKITNTEHPKAYIKPSGYTTLTLLITEHDVFTSGNQGKNGLVPTAATSSTDIYLNSSGTWTSPFPTSQPHDSYLHIDDSGNLEWTSIRLPEETLTYTPVSFTVTRNWTELAGLSLAEKLLLTGTYAIKILYGSSYYSGVASIVVDSTISSDDEIAMHECGSNNNVHLYAKIAPNAQTGNASLWLASNNPLDSNYTLTISFRKLL